jgi:hypothetical protein
MSCFNIFTKNLVDQSTLTPSSENALFPIENIQDYRRTKVFRSTSASANVVFDFNETSDIDTIFILAEKRNGFGFDSITVQFNGTADFSSPAASYSMTFSDEHSLGHLELPAKISYRFARIVVTSSLLSYCEISKVYFGTKAETDAQIKFGWTLKDDELSLKSSNRYGQVFTDVITRQKKINFAFSYVNKDDLAILNTILDDSGETKPIWIKIGDNTMSDDYRRTSGSFYLSDTPQITNAYFNKYNLSFSLVEVT